MASPAGNHPPPLQRFSMLASFRAKSVFIALLIALDSGIAPAKPAQAIQKKVSVRWQEVSVREACRRLSETQGVVIWVDRRLDPQSPITLQCEDETVRQVLERIAQSCGAQLVVLPTLCYLGPTDAAVELPTLLEIAREELKTAPLPLRRKLAQKSSIQWQRLTTPQQIVRELTRPLGVSVGGLDAVPHDLFDAGELPITTATDQLTFFLASFDRMWKIGGPGNRIAIVPIVRPLRIARTYNWRGSDKARLDAVLAQVPVADVRVTGEQVSVIATAQEHEVLRGLLASITELPRTSRPTKRKGPERKLFSLRLQDQSAGAVLRELARQLNLQLQVDEAAQTSLETRISIDIVQVDLNELLETISKAAGLIVKATDEELQVSPR